MRISRALALSLVAIAALCAPASAAPDHAEITYWESVRDSKTPAELEAYLKAYPDGAFAPLARIRLKALQAEKPESAKPAPAADDGASGSEKIDTAKGAASETGNTAESLTLSAKLAKSAIFGAPRTVLGVRLSELQEWRQECFDFAKDQKGAFIDDVLPGTPARDAGLQAGDLIITANGKTLPTARRLSEIVAAQPAGFSIKLEVMRPRVLNDGPRRLKDRAGTNDINAMTCLALMYENGVGWEKDVAEANRWYRKAAEAGGAFAMNNLAYNLQRGNGGVKDLAEANRWYRKSAEAGNSIAMLNFGLNLENGLGVPKDLAEANRWYRTGAEAGYAAAMTALANNLQNGIGITKDAAEANRWFRKSAEAGNTAAMNNLAFNLQRGEGITKDAAEANRWYLKAAEAGEADAMNNLAVNLQNGNGIAKNSADAIRWFRAAADRGHANAMYGLGAAYETGNGVGKDSHQAAQWIFKAVKAGSSHTVTVLRDNTDALSSEFGREFQRLLREAGHYDGDIDGDLGSGTQRAIAALFATSKTTDQSVAADQPSAPAAPAASPAPDLGNVKDLDTLE